MPWIYSVGSEGFQLPSENGSDQSLTVKSTDTARVFLCPECRRGSLQVGLYGTTCKHWRDALSLTRKSTLSQEVSRARISARQELAQVWRESEADYFSRSLDSSKNSGQASFFSKTFLPSGRAVDSKWGRNWPASGMIVDGICYPLKRWERVTSENGGSYLPTPTAQSYGSNKGGAAGRVGKERLSLQTMAKKNLWPTPKANDAQRICLWTETRYNARTNRKSLKSAVGESLSGTEHERSGQLNPQFVEFLMAYPTDWTVLKAWATQWFRSKPAKPLPD